MSEMWIKLGLNVGKMWIIRILGQMWIKKGCRWIKCGHFENLVNCG